MLMIAELIRAALVALEIAAAAAACVIAGAIILN